MSKVEEKLNKIGVTIPNAPTPAANYLPFTTTGNLVFVSGQVPFVDGKLHITGTVGVDASVAYLIDCEAQGKGRAKGRPRKVTQRSFIDGGWWMWTSFP